MTQDTRQAIIELLFLAIYADDHVSHAENEVFNQALETLGWEGDSSRSEFIDKTFAAAKEAHSELSKAQDFFVERAQKIKDTGNEAEALTWLTKVLGADGFTTAESYLLKRLEKFWYPS